LLIRGFAFAGFKVLQSAGSVLRLGHPELFQGFSLLMGFKHFFQVRNTPTAPCAGAVAFGKLGRETKIVEPEMLDQFALAYMEAKTEFVISGFIHAALEP
jgi:hypothetical protein